METDHYIQIHITSRPPATMGGQEYQEQYQKAREFFAAAGYTYILDVTNPVSVGAWDWNPHITSACKATSGLVFSVHVVAPERGYVSIEYYVSGVGFVYRDELFPKYDERLARAALRKAADAKLLAERLAAKQEELRRSALKKLSAEERQALGITNSD